MSRETLRHCWGHRREAGTMIEDCPLRRQCAHWHVRPGADILPVSPAWHYERGLPECGHYQAVPARRRST